MVVFFLALLVSAVYITVLLTIGRGLRSMRQLRHIPYTQPKRMIPVSLIVPACNEAETIEGPLKTLLAQDYPALEIVVVNDRSTDATGQVLARIKRDYPDRLRILEITELPQGWLGKPHALQLGAANSTGELLLFTDADIEMEATTVSRAVAFMEQEQLDHLSLVFQATGGSWLLNAMILDAAGALLAVFKPWKAQHPESACFMGVGAFNMVRASRYRAVAGHETLRLQPVDDIMLGKVLKESGARQCCLLGQAMVRVQWYPNVAAMVEGLMKNAYSLSHYRAWLALASAVAVLLLAYLPMAGVLLASGTSQVIFAFAVLLRLGAVAGASKFCDMPFTVVFGALVSPLINGYIVVRAVWLTHRQKGIYWRGSYYPLNDLKKSRPLLF